MEPTMATCITQIITTLLTVLVSAGIAYFTYRAQAAKSSTVQSRLRGINMQSSLELFKAFSANLLFFISPGSFPLNVKTLSLCCAKIQVLENHLADVNVSDLPDSFIADFQFRRLQISLTRIELQYRLHDCNSTTISSDCFDELDLSKLIKDITKFIEKYETARK